jgi:hypothetical protein
MITSADIRAGQLAKGGRAHDRLRGAGKAYLPHDLTHGLAATRRRRQMAKKGLYGCASCEQWTEAAKLTRTVEGHLVCDECLIAAGITPVHASAAAAIGATHDHELHQWEGEGGR